MPVLGLPLLLFGLAALPVAAGIYWLRTRFRRQEVSTLFLWRSAVEAQGGGRKRSRLQTPLALLLELLAIALLVLAATAPRVLRAGHTASVTVVLDDSYSMRAVDRDGVSARQRAIDTLQDELDRLGRYSVRLIAAGREPRTLGAAASEWPALRDTLDGWACASSSADLDAAVALAGELAGPRGRLLVLSDHPMPAPAPAPGMAAPGSAAEEASAGAVEVSESEVETSGGSFWGRLRWVSVGQPQPNLAVVNAVRSTAAGPGDTLLLEIANLGREAAVATMTLRAGTSDTAYRHAADTPPVGEDGPMIERRRLELAAGETRRLWLRPEGVADRPVVVSLEDDWLSEDNRAVLMPTAPTPLPVRVSVEDADLRRALDRALSASGRVTLEAERPALVFTDGDAIEADGAGGSGGAGWTVRFDAGEPESDADPPAYLGPFVIDFDHPATQGISLAGLVWATPPPPEDGAEAQADVARGRPIIAAGNEVLVSDRAWPDGRHAVTVRLRPDRSTLLSSAAFPVMVWNLLDWRQSARPGLTPVNTRPGVPISIVASRSDNPGGASESIDEVTVRQVNSSLSDDDSPLAETLPLDAGRAAFVPDRPGVYEARVGDRRHRFAVLGNSAQESDLRRAVPDTFGAWDDQVAITREYQSLAWVLGLAALAVLGLHAYLLYRTPAPGIARSTSGGSNGAGQRGVAAAAFSGDNFRGRGGAA
jgi:hypothetical protein